MLLTTTVTELGQEPVTVDEVKVSARIDADITELDGQIATLIKSTRLVAEHECGRLFLPCTMCLGYDDWPTDIWPLLLVTELVKVEVLDLVTAGWVAMPNWTLERDASGLNRIVYSGGALPPLLEVPGVRVRATVNVGCPENVRAYIIAMVCHQLTTNTAGKSSSPPEYLSGLLDREKRWS